MLNNLILDLITRRKVNKSRSLSKSSASRLRNPLQIFLPGYLGDLKSLNVHAHGWTATVFTGPAVLMGNLALFVLLNLLYRVMLDDSVARQNLPVYIYLILSGSILIYVGVLLLTEKLRLHWRDRSSITLAATPLLHLIFSTGARDGAWNVRLIKRFIRFKNAWVRLGYPEDNKSLILLQKYLDDDRRPTLQPKDFERLAAEVHMMIGQVYAARSAMISEVQKGRTTPPINATVMKILKFTAYTVPIASIIQTIRTLVG